MNDHRYPEEVKKDYRHRVTLARHPELVRLLQQYGTASVIGAALTCAGEGGRRGLRARAVR